MSSTIPELSFYSQVVARLDLLYEPNPRAPLLREDQDILVRRARRVRQSFKVNHLSPYCLRIFLDGEKLQAHQLDAADIQEEIQTSFPRHFEILRSGCQYDHRFNRLRLRPILPDPAGNAESPVTFNETNPIHDGSLKVFLSRLKVASARIHQTVPLSSVGDDETFREQIQAKRDALSATYDAFFERIGNIDWVSHHGYRGVIISTDRDMNDELKTMVYDPRSKFMERGDKCPGCTKVFLPRELQTQDVGRDYCPDCFERDFFRCKSCSITFESKESVVAPCNCKYCTSCFGHHFTAGLSPSDFPPRCCDQELNVIKYRRFIPDSSLKLYAQIIDQYNDTIQLHCATQSCRSYIKPSLVSDEWGLCEKCFAVTCQRCRLLRQLHGRSDLDSQRQCPDKDGAVPEVNVDTGDHVREETTPSPSEPRAVPIRQSQPSSPLSPSQSQPAQELPASPPSPPKQRCESHDWTKPRLASDVLFACHKCRARLKLSNLYYCQKCLVHACWKCKALRRI